MVSRSYVPNPSNLTPQAPGVASAGTSPDVSRADHVHPIQSVPPAVISVSPSTPARTLNSAGFQPSATKPVLCSYTIQTQVTNPLLVGTSSATVQLLSDSNSTPVTERCRVGATSGVGITVTVALTTANISTLTYICPAGHYVRLVGATAGTATNTILAQTEEVIG